MSIPQPVFILASPYSFTSIVCAMLSQHPDAYGVPELNLLTTDTVAELIQTIPGKFQGNLHGLWRTIAQLYAGEQTIQSVEMARRWLHRRRKSTTAEVYQELCGKVAPLQIIEQNTVYGTNAEAMARIAKTFPHAKYLYLYRHPIDQGKSMLSSSQGVASLLAANSLDFDTEIPTVDPQYAWYSTQKHILAFLETIAMEQQMHLRGEDLLSNPRRYLEEICSWLGWSWSDSIYEFMLRTEQFPYACMGPYHAQGGSSYDFQKSPQFQPQPVLAHQAEESLPWRKDEQGLRTEVREMLVSFGYV